MLTMVKAACALIVASLAAAPAYAEQPANVVSVRSQQDFDATLARLRAALDARGFTTFAVIDHAKGAASIGEALRPTTLVIFGNPKGGTPLMQAEQTLGLELPLKMLVAEGPDGAVTLYYLKIDKIVGTFGVTGQDQRLTAISEALNAIAAEAAAH